jgi:hypothetical protein
LLLAVAPAVLGAQDAARAGEGGRVLAANVVLGASTAVVRALVERRNVWRAATYGALGGAVHFTGKVAGAGRMPGSALAGVAVASLGTSIVANAGRGAAPLSELYLPVGPLHLHVRGGTPSKVRLTVNAFDVALLASIALHDGARVDWRATAAHGTFVFEARDHWLRLGRTDAEGVSMGSTILISALTADRAQLLRHEATHVMQHHFLNEAWGRPLEDGMRARVNALRWLPSWIELGVVDGAILGAQYALDPKSRGPLGRLAESEADWFMRR